MAKNVTNDTGQYILCVLLHKQQYFNSKITSVSRLLVQQNTSFSKTQSILHTENHLALRIPNKGS